MDGCQLNSDRDRPHGDDAAGLDPAGRARSGQAHLQTDHGVSNGRDGEDLIFNVRIGKLVLRIST